MSAAECAKNQFKSFLHVVDGHADKSPRIEIGMNASLGMNGTCMRYANSIARVRTKDTVRTIVDTYFSAPRLTSGLRIVEAKRLHHDKDWKVAGGSSATEADRAQNPWWWHFSEFDEYFRA